MAERDSIDIWEDFAGVDYFSSDLTRAFPYFQNLKNYQFGQGGGLKGRRGFQVEGQRGAFRSGALYSYLNTTSGATTEEVLAANDYLWRRVESGISVTYSGAGSWYYTVTLSGSDYIFTLYGNGAATLTKNMGTGEEAEPYTVWQLSQDITALADYSATFSTADALIRGRVNGLQSGVSTINIIGGHTLNFGNLIQFYDHLTGKLTARRVTSSAATTVTFAAGYGTVNVKDGQDIGAVSSPAAGIRMTNATTAKSSPGTIPFFYWQPVKYNLNTAVGTSPLGLTWGATNPKPHSFVSANNVCYIGQTRQVPREEPQAEEDPDGKILKYDGNRVYRAGMVQGGWSSFTPTAGSNTWRYMVTREQIDHRGNIVEGEPSTISTQTSATTNVSCVITNIEEDTNSGWFNTACAIVSGNQSGAGTQTGLTVDAAHTLSVGDIVSIYDEVTGAIVRRTLTVVANTTITWASTTAIQVSDNAAISNGLTWKVWRTKNLGVDFYLVLERPNDAFNATTTVSDTLADTSLLIKYQFAQSGREHNPPPAANFLCTHQGCLVGAGDRTQPNTIAYSLPGDLEYWPTSANSFDVPSAQLGPITAIASDSDNRLAVFKENAYYDCEGDLDLGLIVPRTVCEGDYGVFAHSALTRAKELLWGLGPLGPVAIKDGRLNSVFGLAVRPAFTAVAAQGNVTAAFAVNDARNIMLRFYVNGGVVTPLVLDYEDESGYSWFNWEYASAVTPSAGMVASSDDIFNIGTNQFFRELNVATGTATQNYHDSTAAITYVAKTTAFHDDEPSIDKTWHDLVLYNYMSELDDDDFTAFTSTIKTYRNRSAVAHTSTTKTWASTDYEKQLALKDNKARHLSIELTTAAVGECPRLSGMTILFSRPYEKTNPAE